MTTTTRLPHTADTPCPTPAEGWDDPSADAMDRELDEQAQGDLEHNRNPNHA